MKFHPYSRSLSNEVLEVLSGLVNQGLKPLVYTLPSMEVLYPVTTEFPTRSSHPLGLLGL